MTKVIILLFLIALCFTVSAAFISVGKREKPGFYTIFCYFSGIFIGVVFCLCLLALIEILP